jgi:hypothetical protein
VREGQGVGLLRVAFALLFSSKIKKKGALYLFGCVVETRESTLMILMILLSFFLKNIILDIN